jgi:hypothetical protein
MPKIILSPDEVEIQYSSWIKMLIDLISPQNLYLVGGRGVAKSSDILAERSLNVIYDMPRASFAFVSDTYVNLLSNILPAIQDGWTRKKFYDGVHYVVNKPPPDSWALPFVPTITFQHTISCFNGSKFLLKSLDRPSINAGISVAHHFGDEAKYLKKDKLNRLFPTLRGDAVLLRHSPYFMGQTFCTDMPNGAYGDDTWILDMQKKMDKTMIEKIVQTAMVVNDIQLKIMYAKRKSTGVTTLRYLNNQLLLWQSRLNKIRHNSTYFHVVSSFANCDILTLDYFKNLLSTLGPEEFRTSVLSLPGSLSVESRFYFNLNENNFYQDSYNYAATNAFALSNTVPLSSGGLKHCIEDQPLEAGFDAGNMMSLLIGQDQGNVMRALKFMYTLVPEFIEHLAWKFLDYFSDHKTKLLFLYYDRSANAYGLAKKDFASQLKQAIETRDGKRTGWNVMLMSLSQRNIEHWQEYKLVNEMLSGRNKDLPQILIDGFECRELKSSLELAPMDKSKGKIVKVKKSEKLPLKRLPLESTNASDAFKYWICRKRFIQILKGKTVAIGDPKVR